MKKCPYGEDTVMCNLETVYIEEEKDNELDGGEL